MDSPLFFLKSFRIFRKEIVDRSDKQKADSKTVSRRDNQ